MGKSSKKSTPKVNAAAAVNPTSKAGKKVKREAEESIEKLISAKKQKTDEGLKQAVQKNKSKVKTHKKKKEESSSSDDSSSEEEQMVKVVTKNVPKATMPPVKDSSSEESSSDEEPAPNAAIPSKKQQVTTKNGSVSVPAKKEKGDSSSESSSEESLSDEEAPSKPAVPTKQQQVAAKNGSLGAAAKKGKQDSSSDSSDDESDDEDEVKVDAKNGSVGAPAKKGKAEASSDASVSKPTKPPVEDSSSEESSSDDESDENEKTLAKPTSQVKKVPGSGSKKASSSSSESSDSESDSSSDEETVKAPIPKSVQQVSGKKADSKDSSDDSDSDETSEEEKAALASKKATLPATNKKASSDSSSDDSSDDDKDKMDVDKANEEEGSEESSDEEESDDEKPLKTPKKNPKTPVTPEANTGSKTLFVGNLSFQVERADVENFFKGAGEVVDVRFALDRDQRFKGFGHVEFATAEAAQKALKLNGQSLNGREVRLDLARERGERAPYTPYSGGKDYNSFQKGGRGQVQKIFVRGFDRCLGEDEIRSALGEHFKSCGEINRISIPTEYETGAIKGMAYLEFQDADGFNKALGFNGSEFGDRYLTVEEAKPPRTDNRDGGGWGSGRGGGGGRSGGGRFGGRGGSGGLGGRGRGRGGPFKPSVTAAASGKKTTFEDDDE